MARSPTGTFTLVAGNPVVTGTIITSDWANTTMPDIGAALTDSLSRTGQGGMLAPIRGVSGSATAPAHSFTDFPRSGMYAIGANEMRYAVNGVDRMRWQAGGLPTQTYNVATGLWEDLEPVGVVGPNLLDNSNFQIRQRGNSDSSGNYGTFIDRYNTRGVSGTGGTTTISAPTLNSSGISYRVFSVNAAGHTSYWYMRQSFKVGRINSGADYTFSLRANLMDNPIKLKAKLRGYDASAGAWAELGEGDLDIDSYGTYSVTFLDVVSSLPLSADDDYIQIELTGSDADNGSNFVLPDGAYRFEWFKLEEGNTFTGYEPTPYAVDEAECMKWYQEISGRWTGYPQLNSTTNLLRGADVNFPAVMYFTPAVTVTSNSAWTPTVTGYKSLIRTSGNANTAASGTWINDYTASCEL